jgi:hypothetical protein
MQTKIMLTLTVVVIAGAWAALAGGNGIRRLTTARMRSGSTAKARSGYEEALKRRDRLALLPSNYGLVRRARRILTQRRVASGSNRATWRRGNPSPPWTY